MSQRRCKPDDWDAWADGTCTFKTHQPPKKSTRKKIPSVKKAEWMRCKDWSWNQLDGFQGNGKQIIGKRPIHMMAATYDGELQTKTIYLKDRNIYLQQMADALNEWMLYEDGDQSLVEIRPIAETKECVIIWLYFDN